MAQNGYNGNGSMEVVFQNGNGHKPGKFTQQPVTIDIPPADPQAEQSTLGSILIDPDQILFIREIVKPNDFYDLGNGYIYQAILDLADSNSRLDLLILSDELERTNKLDKIGLGEGVSYLTSLMNATPTGLHGPYYAEIVKRCSVNRQLISGSQEIVQFAYKNTLDPDEALEKASKIVLDISTGNVVDKPKPAAVFVSELYDTIERRAADEEKALTTSLKALDFQLAGGLWPRKLYVLGGRPGMAKTSLAIQIAKENAKQKKNILFVSIEMGGSELVGRMISAEAGIDGSLIEAGQIPDGSYSKFLHHLNVIRGLDTLFIDDRTHSIEGIKSRSIIKAATGLDLIIVDSLQKITTSARYATRASEIGTFSGTLARLTKELKIPVLLISTLNRGCEARPDKRPMMHDLKESGDIEHDADVVMFGYRDEIYNEDTEYPNLAEILVRKHRGGKVGKVKTFFQKELTKFSDIALEQHQLN